MCQGTFLSWCYIRSNYMLFSPHVNNIVSKASKILNFVKRNLYKCSPSIKATAYISLVRPILEYASSAWDPHLLKNIYSIDQIQRRTARWVLQNYNRYSSVTSMQQQLNWSTLLYIITTSTEI